VPLNSFIVRKKKKKTTKKTKENQQKTRQLFRPSKNKQNPVVEPNVQSSSLRKKAHSLSLLADSGQRKPRKAENPDPQRTEECSKMSHAFALAALPAFALWGCGWRDVDRAAGGCHRCYFTTL
jgi:septal ring factor EnvC (AmiA/AmiB activator)